MSKKMIIKGVGTFMAKRYKEDGKGVEVLTLGTLQDLRIDLNVEIDDIFGGDGLFAIDTLVRNKSISVTATDAKFDLDAIQLMMGSTVQEKVTDSLWVINEQHSLLTGSLDSNSATPISVTEAEPDFGDSLFSDGNFSVRIKDQNTLLEKVPYDSTTAPTDEQFMVDTSGTTVRVILADTHANKDVVMNYQREDEVDLVDILVDEVPFPVHVVHHGSFLQKDGSYQGVETELFQCRARGSFSIDAQRASASTTAIELQILDPERADGKLGTIKRYNATKKV